MARVVARRQPIFPRRTLEVVVADVVGAALQQRDGHRHAQRVAHQRQVAFEQLILQSLGAGGDDHLAAVQQRGDEIGERLAGAGAGLGDKLAACGDSLCDGLGHRQLLRPEVKAGQFARERSTFAEDRSECSVAGGRLRRFG